MKRMSPAVLIPAFFLTLGLALAVSAALTPAQPAPDRVERGRYLVTAMACVDCHTPWKLGANGPEPDVSRGFSGHPHDLAVAPAPSPAPQGWPVAASPSMTAWAGPWGISFSANLTPDVETGIGAWSAENFIQALRTGRHMGRGRPILPPMPAASFRNLNDEDLTSIFAYLQSQKPVRNLVPQPVPPAIATDS